MQILKTVSAYKVWLKKQNTTIGFVPTMGALHDGHLSLIKKSKKLCLKTVVSIYINPTQFSPDEDLDSYPKSLTDDLNYLKKLKVDVVFLPTDNEIYPENEKKIKYENDMFSRLEGQSRPHFFYGVTVVVLKLFKIINPTHTFFGEKDAQQARIIKKMISDFNLNINFVSCSTVRDDNGLALSSRNSYLSLEDQNKASVVYKSLMAVNKSLLNGEVDANKLKKLFKKSILLDSNFKIDYFSIACNESLRELKTVKPNTLVSTAVFFKKVRLIDNFVYQSST